MRAMCEASVESRLGHQVKPREVKDQDVGDEQRQRSRDLGLDDRILVSSSSSAAGTMLKLAAIGVISVPQKPDSIPTAPITAALPPS